MKSLAILFLVLAPAVAADPRPKLAPCSDQIRTTGPYQNETYSFSIVIPAGRVGVWNSIPCREDAAGECTCMSDHGRRIPLADYVSVEISADFTSEANPIATVLLDDFDNFHAAERLAPMTVQTLECTRLGELPGYRYVAETTRDGVAFVREAFLVESQKLKIVYRIWYDSRADLSERYRKEFQSFVASFRVGSRLEPPN